MIKIIVSDILSHFLLLLLLLLPIFVVQSYSIINDNDIVTADIKRSDFPDTFLFGTATSAYQIEGAVLQDGRTPSNWDAFCQIQGNVDNGDNGVVADDHYHRFMEDIEIMYSLGVDSYRFSISWSRLLPRGKFGEVNQAAILFYNSIIDNLLIKGIEPFVTIFHFDFPEELQDRYGGWLSPLMQEEFVHFAEICFQNFGDRVKNWITINEPNLFSQMTYQMGLYPPSHCSTPFGKCSTGNSDIEPLISAHNLLLAHAKAAKLYRENFKAEVNGTIGISVHAFMYLPFTDSEEDKEAASRALAFNLAWVLDPLVYGDYPLEMKHYLGTQLPKFSSDEMLLLKDSIDFIGINHYASLYAKDCIHSKCNDSTSNHAISGFLSTTVLRDGVFIGEPTGISWFYVVPRGMEGIINYVKERYNNKLMFVTENGYSSLVGEDDEQDVKRIDYHKSYLAYLAKAIRNGANVGGYFVWSLMDNFEWNSGYKTKFGLYHIETQTLNRVPKLSASWFKNFLGNWNCTNIVGMKQKLFDH